jgi:hypothetical protein
MAPFRAPRLLVSVSATRRAALHAVADPRAGNRGSARRSTRRPAPDNLGRTMGLCVSLTASFWEGEDGRYGNQGRRSGNVVLCWRRRVDRGSARHPCKRDHRRSSRARSRVDTRCARRMALSPGQHLAGGWEAPRRSARRPAQTSDRSTSLRVLAPLPSLVEYPDVELSVEVRPPRRTDRHRPENPVEVQVLSSA